MVGIPSAPTNPMPRSPMAVVVGDVEVLVGAVEVPDDDLEMRGNVTEVSTPANTAVRAVLAVIEAE
jgi:hypothetical protein